jgi:hypothetical protein
LNFVHSAPKPSHRKENLQQRLKVLTPDYDNRYVWFTRNIHSESRNQDELHMNNLNGFLYHKKSTVKVENIFAT